MELLFLRKVRLFLHEDHKKEKLPKEKKKEYFFGKTKLNANEIELAKEKIFIGINTDMFNLDKHPFTNGV